MLQKLQSAISFQLLAFSSKHSAFNFQPLSSHFNGKVMKVGILGGGQLGRMLLQAAANYVVETYVLENDEACRQHTYARTLLKAILKILIPFTTLVKWLMRLPSK